MDNPNDQKANRAGRRSCLDCLGRGAIGVLGVLVIALTAGAIYQAAASASDSKKYPPPGELYDVGEYRMHLYCIGDGSPTVILEAGASSPGLTCYAVQKEVAVFTRVCSYDRPGFGWSDPAAGPLTGEQVVALLHQLLVEAEVPEPCILVGHSIGGVYVRSYAHRYPAEVTGMVLVDSSHESQNLRFPLEYSKFSRRQTSSMKLMQLACPLGILRATRFWNLMLPEPPLPADMGSAVWATMYRTPYCKAENSHQYDGTGCLRSDGPGFRGSAAGAGRSVHPRKADPCRGQWSLHPMGPAPICDRCHSGCY